jgi:hypothetical protein
MAMFGRGLETKRFSDAANGRCFKWSAIDRYGEPGLRTRFRLGRTPIVRDAVGGEKRPDLATVGVKLGARNLHTRGRHFPNDLLAMAVLLDMVWKMSSPAEGLSRTSSCSCWRSKRATRQRVSACNETVWLVTRKMGNSPENSPAMAWRSSRR